MYGLMLYCLLLFNDFICMIADSIVQHKFYPQKHSQSTRLWRKFAAIEHAVLKVNRDWSNSQIPLLDWTQW